MIKSRKRILYYTIGFLIIGFIVLTILVSVFPASVIDQMFSEEIQENRNPVLDASMKIISWLGYMPVSLIMVLTTALIFYLLKYKKEALYVVITLSSGIVSTIVKIGVNRPRPTQDMVNIIEKATNQSFPSGHTLFYVVFFGFLVVLMSQLKQIQSIVRKTISGICLMLIFTVPFSRIYLGAHWFTDVLGGFILGIICLFVLSYFYLEKAEEKVTDPYIQKNRSF